MRSCVTFGWMVLVLAGLAGGCTSNGPQEQPVHLPLSDKSTFEVDDGRAVVKPLRFAFEDFEAQIGGGRFAIQPEDVVLTESNTNGATVDGCTADCTSNGLDAATCAAVCEDGKVLVRVRISASDDPAVVCAEGDAYGPFLVTIGTNGVGTAASPASQSLGNETLTGINGESLTVCIGVVAPVEGTLELTKLTLTVTP